MPAPSATTGQPGAFTIAGVRFSLPGTADDVAFPDPFRAFQTSTEADLACAVSSLGPSPALAEAPLTPDTPWRLRATQDSCQIDRCDRTGACLWRMEAPLAFDRATVAWHPTLFEHVYGSYARAWGMGIGWTALVFRLRAHGGLLLHGVAAELEGEGIVGVGPSGAGKSTLARLLHAAGATVLSDERPIVRQWPPPGSAPHPDAAGSFRVYGSPWPSSAGFACNACAPLRRLYFLEHGPEERLTPLTPAEAFRRLIHVATIPWQEATLFDPCLATVESLLHATPCSVFSFRPTPAAVERIRQDLRPE